MASFNCVPSTRTVAPCPSGTAPDVVTVTSAASAPEFYPSNFDHMPVQDVLFALGMVLCFVAGIAGGRRR